MSAQEKRRLKRLHRRYFKRLYQLRRRRKLRPLWLFLFVMLLSIFEAGHELPHLIQLQEVYETELYSFPSDNCEEVISIGFRLRTGELWMEKKVTEQVSKNDQG